MNTNQESQRNINEQFLLEKFPQPLRVMLWAWSRWLSKLSTEETTQQATQNLDKSLATSNAVVFFDHQIPFDVIPAALALSRNITNAEQVLAPYASYLEMGVTDNGNQHLYFNIRSALFRWINNRITDQNDNIILLPVVRSFEARNPKMREIVQKKYLKSNAKYLQSLQKFLLEGKKSGKICFLAPMAGLAKPNRPVLNPNVYASLDSIQSQLGEQLFYYIVGAYAKQLLPGLPTSQSLRYAPFMHRYTTCVSGPYKLPNNDYTAATDVVQSAISQIRK
jgi:hypothetical protein